MGTQQRGIDHEEAHRLVGVIIDRFRFWLEDRRHSVDLWDRNEKPRPEKTAQRMFFMIAEEICRQRNLDITPEADSGGGPVDFKFSVGFNCRILVEIKLSTNRAVVPGLTSQLEAYKKAEDANGAYYVVINLGGAGDIKKELIKANAEFDFKEKKPSEIIFIDGVPRASASRLHKKQNELPI